MSAKEGDRWLAEKGIKGVKNCDGDRVSKCKGRNVREERHLMGLIDLIEEYVRPFPKLVLQLSTTMLMESLLLCWGMLSDTFIAIKSI